MFAPKKLSYADKGGVFYIQSASNAAKLIHMSSIAPHSRLSSSMPIDIGHLGDMHVFDPDT